MKKILIYIFILLFTVGCLDDKSNYDYKDLNDFANWDKNGVNNVKNSYTLYPDEEIRFEPKVRFSIDTLNPDASYAWYLGEEEKMTLLSDQLNYTYRAEQLGDFVLLFCATDNKSGVTFSKEIEVTVVAPWKNGWMILSRSAGNESQLSLILSKKQSKTMVVDGKEQSKDTVVYVGEAMNVVPALGQGPRKLVENFIYPTASGIAVEDEVMVLQESGAVELDGNDLIPVGYAKNEFFDGVPDNFDPVDAVLSYGGKWLLSADNYIYQANLSVAIDLHSGFYLKDPSLNGKKVKALLPYFKGDNYGNFLIVGIDENNTYFGIMDDGECARDDNSYTILPANYIGSYLELVNLSQDEHPFLFKNVEGEFVFHAWANSAGGHYAPPAYFSILRQNGNYYWHRYELNRANYSYKPGHKMIVESSEYGELPASIMNDYRCAALLPWQELLVVASGNKLNIYNYWDKFIFNFASLPVFNSEIVGLAVKDYDTYYKTLNAHLAVALKSGEVYVFEVKYDNAEQTAEFVELYHKDGFGEIVDIEYKFGNGSRPGSGGLY
ncbi:PKD-like family lipoprotein [Butyricimonas synergistica]|mgnify:FL=1|uniref:PKD-like family lipoprotein n=1 Tax=Butyricimonas synergistica TaxID=544644 RepID=UPI0003750980|nr:PKD-like family lipoprotein [Butyricimonas synergistica]